MLSCTSPFLRFATNKTMGFEKTFDHGDTDLNAMVISQMIFDLLMGQIRPFDRLIHR